MAEPNWREFPIYSEKPLIQRIAGKTYRVQRAKTIDILTIVGVWRSIFTRSTRESQLVN